MPIEEIPNQERWVPDSEREPRWFLWNELYLIRVPFIQTMSPDYIKHFGMPSSGHAEWDQATAHEPVMRMASIVQMIEFWQNGAKVGVVNRADTKRIYERISAHLAAWKRELESGFAPRNAPLQDLKLMDEFANVIYEHAKYQFNQDYIDSVFANRMRSTVSVTRETILKKKPGAVSVNNGSQELADQIEQQASQYPERVSMADVFASRELAGKAKWKV